jgi:hypothetical protein
MKSGTFIRQSASSGPQGLLLLLQQEIKKGASLHNPKETPFISSNLCRSTGIFWKTFLTACNFTPCTWWANQDLNLGPSGYEPVALPTELLAQKNMKRIYLILLQVAVNKKSG